MSATKSFVFVLMPFAKEFDDIYKFGIKQTCEQLGCYCERVDEQIFQESILERIYNQISKADILIADMTGKNPNVFYEVGYAHGLGKKVILLTQKTEDIPFDFKHFQHIVYDSSAAKLQAELGKNVRWMIENPEKRDEALISPLEIYVNDQAVHDGKPIFVKSSVRSDTLVGLNIIVMNKSSQIVRTEKFRVLIEYPKGTQFLPDAGNDNVEFANLAESTRQLTAPIELVPGAFNKVPCKAVFKKRENDGTIPLAIHLLRESGPTIYHIGVAIT